MITKHEVEIQKLADALLEKETLDLLDIISIIGERPFPLSDSMKDYMKEIESRRADKLKKDEEEKNKPKEEEKKSNDKSDNDDKNNNDDGEKEDEYDKDKDLHGKDKDEKKGSGVTPPQRGRRERELADAETVMKEEIKH